MSKVDNADVSLAISVRLAKIEDLSAIVRLLADDDLGAKRERYGDPLPSAYVDAFERVQAQAGNCVMVACLDGQVIGCLQLTLIPGLSHVGATRALIEGVRVDARIRSRGIGERLVEAAIDSARAHDCRMVQLTTDKSRLGAHRFYERLGFVASHVGMKLLLSEAPPAATPQQGRLAR